MQKKSILIGVIIVVFAMFAIVPAIADETAEPKQTEKEQQELIQLSQEMAEKEKTPPKKRFVMYAIGLDSEYGEVNLGGRLELSLLTNLRFVVEGVELEKGKPVVGFASLMFVLNRRISPYIGGGVGTETRYQLFAGVEIGNFFVEVKYVGEGEINTETADVYSVVGFKISF